MRILSGKLKGSKIHTNNNKIMGSEDFITRPTSDRVKETLFKIVQNGFNIDFANVSFLDCFSGSGAIGLEVECVPDRVAELITNKVNLLTLSMGSGPNCDVEFLFIQDVIGTNTDRIPRHAKVFKDTNKSYQKLLDVPTWNLLVKYPL